MWEGGGHVLILWPEISSIGKATLQLIHELQDYSQVNLQRVPVFDFILSPFGFSFSVGQDRP